MKASLVLNILGEIFLKPNEDHFWKEAKVSIQKLAKLEHQSIAQSFLHHITCISSNEWQKK